jgi:hypothetical protein
MAMLTLRVRGGKGMTSYWNLRFIFANLFDFCLCSIDSLTEFVSLGTSTRTRETLVGS